MDSIQKLVMLYSLTWFVEV